MSLLVISEILGLFLNILTKVFCFLDKITSIGGTDSSLL